MDTRYLGHLMSIAQASPAGAGSDQGGVMDTELPDPQDEGETWQNPFETGQQLNQLEGTLGDGIEHLLPNPVTRHKLAYMRLSDQTARWLGLKQQCQQWPLPDSIRQRLDDKLAKQMTSLKTLSQQIKTDAHQQVGWLSWLVNPWVKPLMPVPVDHPAAMLWQLADTPDEQAQLYASLTQT
jgi:hypothetical protein